MISSEWAESEEFKRLMAYKDKLKSLGLIGSTENKSKIVPKYRDDDGTLAGHEIHHWEDRIDATANLKVVNIKGDNDAA
jgi:hypothetical protein